MTSPAKLPPYGFLFPYTVNQQVRELFNLDCIQEPSYTDLRNRLADLAVQMVDLEILQKKKTELLIFTFTPKILYVHDVSSKVRSFVSVSPDIQGRLRDIIATAQELYTSTLKAPSFLEGMQGERQSNPKSPLHEKV